MPLPTTFAGDSSRGEGQFTTTASLPQTYWITTYKDNINYSTSGNISIDKIATIKTDSSGNVYSLGSVSFILSGNATQGTVLIKQNSSGTILWAKGIDTSVDSTPSDMALDLSGNIYVITLYSSVVAKPRLTKFDSSGNVVWSYSFTMPSYNPSFTDISISSTYDIYIAFRYNTTYQGLLRLSPYGVILWCYGYSSNNGGNAVSWPGRQGIAITSSQNIVIGGYNPSLWDSYGTLQEALGNTGPGNYALSAVTIDSSNNIYLAGMYSSNFGIVLKLDNSFTNLLWGWTYGPTTTVTGNSNGFGCIGLDSSNNVIVGGDTYITGGGTWIGLAAKIANDGTGNLLNTASFSNVYQPAAGIGVLPSTFTLNIDSYGSIYFGGFVPTTQNDGAKIPTYTTNSVIIKDQNPFAITHAGTYTMNSNVQLRWLGAPDYVKKSSSIGSSNISPAVSAISMSSSTYTITTNNALTAGNQPGIVPSFVTI